MTLESFVFPSGLWHVDKSHLRNACCYNWEINLFIYIEINVVFFFTIDCWAFLWFPKVTELIETCCMLRGLLLWRKCMFQVRKKEKLSGMSSETRRIIDVSCILFNMKFRNVFGHKIQRSLDSCTLQLDCLT